MSGLKPPTKKLKLEAKYFGIGTILDLPPKILKLIFKKLPQFEVQNNIALVCKSFLDVTRLPEMVKSAKIKLSIENEENCLNKIKHVLKFYDCSLELEFKESMNMVGMFPLKKLKRHITAIKKLVRI